MTNDELVAIATAAGVIVAAVFGVGGLVVGVIGLVQARGAKKVARKANSIAKRANEIIRAQEARQTERSDVDWEWRYDNTHPQHIIILNIGKNLARDVVAQFTFDDATEANPVMDVEGRAELKLEIPGLAEARQRAWERAEIARLSVAPDPAELHRIRVRLGWNTPLGSPRQLDTGPLLLAVEPFARDGYR